jgi:hypothetical protein
MSQAALAVALLLLCAAAGRVIRARIRRRP